MYFHYLTLDGYEVAQAFHYDRPSKDWRPDPKYLDTGTEVLKPITDSSHHCEHCRGPVTSHNT